MSANYLYDEVFKSGVRENILNTAGLLQRHRTNTDREVEINTSTSNLYLIHSDSKENRRESAIYYFSTADTLRGRRIEPARQIRILSTNKCFCRM